MAENLKDLKISGIDPPDNTIYIGGMININKAKLSATEYKHER